MDKIFVSFLRAQFAEATALAAASEIFSLTPVAGDPPWRFLFEFRCAGLACVDGRIGEAGHFVVGVTLRPDYLRRKPVIPELLTLLKPEQAYHPNIRHPYICIGDVAPGTGLVDLCHRLYEVLSYQKLTPVEGDALNASACVWARENMDRFPLDTRPLKGTPVGPGAPSGPGAGS